MTWLGGEQVTRTVRGMRSGADAGQDVGVLSAPPGADGVAVPLRREGRWPRSSEAVSATVVLFVQPYVARVIGGTCPAMGLWRCVS